MSKKIKETIPVDPEVLRRIKEIIDIAEYCKYSFFWSNNGNQYSRTRRSKELSRDTVTWVDGEDEFSARYDFSQSRAHTYARGVYYRNGERTTLTAVRNSYNRLVEASKNPETHTNT